AARATGGCWSCWITGSPSRDTARYFSTACRITGSPPNWLMWRCFSMFEVTIEETFAAGHALRNYRGKCENVHGHNYRCQVTLEGGQLDSIGLLVDFVEMKRVVHAVLDRMDHQWLNAGRPEKPVGREYGQVRLRRSQSGTGREGRSARGRRQALGNRHGERHLPRKVVGQASCPCNKPGGRRDLFPFSSLART